MKIIHIITNLERGGAELMLAQLLRRTDSNQYKQMILCLGKDSVLAGSLRANGISVCCLAISSFIDVLLKIPTIVRTFKGFAPDLVMSWLYHSDVVASFMRLVFPDVKLAWNIRCSRQKLSQVSLGSYVSMRVLPFLSKCPDLVIYNSFESFLAHESIGLRPSTHRILPNGFDLERWRKVTTPRRKQSRAMFGISSEVYLIGLVARVHKIKNHECFVRSAKLLVERNPRFKFILAGIGADGDNRWLCELLEKYEMRSHFFLAGEQENTELVYWALDVLVLTSHSEGFPNVLGEGMACGIPCVSTDVGEASNIIGSTGLVVPLNDHLAIANAVEQLCIATPTSKLRRSINAHRRVAEKYDMAVVAEQYLETFKDLNEE